MRIELMIGKGEEWCMISYDRMRLRDAPPYISGAQ